MKSWARFPTSFSLSKWIPEFYQIAFKKTTLSTLEPTSCYPLYDLPIPVRPAVEAVAVGLGGEVREVVAVLLVAEVEEALPLVEAAVVVVEVHPHRGVALAEVGLAAEAEGQRVEHFQVVEVALDAEEGDFKPVIAIV
jgi:hypothetical protein